jgi:hypothetical protein
MLRTVLGGERKTRLLFFCSYALLAFVIAAPAAYAHHGTYNKDWGQVHCERGKEAFQVRARGNPVTVRAHSGNGVILVSDKFRTYSGASTRVYHPGTRFQPNPNFVEWIVFVKSGERHAYVSRDGSYGYCY